MKPSIRILHSSRVTQSPGTACWIYLGKNVEPYRWVRQCLGAENERFYDAKLRETSGELWQPFLDFVEAVGAQQKDALTWWSTRFSWKIWTASDLFLLVCYLAVAESCAEEAGRERLSLLIVVEDRWLLRQIREGLGACRWGLRVEDVPLHGERLKQLFLGAARRVKWLAATLIHYIRQRISWPHAGLPVPAAPAAGIASYLSLSALETPGEWRDVYLPGLDRLLTEEGLQVVRFTAPECAGWEYPISRRSAFAYPLILWLSPKRLLRSLAVSWRPRWPRPLRVKGHDIRWLCLREAWLEAGRSSLCAYRLHYECLRAALAQGPWRFLIASYENQPWERLQVLAARAQGVRSVAVQINPFSRFWLSYALGRAGQDRTSLPDAIGSSGEAAHRLLLECGTPASILKPCGALRYPDLAGRLSKPNWTGPSSVERSRILVALPIDPVLTRHLLEALNASFPDGGAGEGLSFVIRPHPMCALGESWVRFPAKVSDTSFTNLQQDLDACGTVLFAASTVGFEALAQGKMVLRYRSPRLMDVDENCGPHLPAAGDSDFRERLLDCVQNGWPPGGREEALSLVSSFLGPLNAKAVGALFRDKIPLPQRESPSFAESAHA